MRFLILAFPLFAMLPTFVEAQVETRPSEQLSLLEDKAINESSGLARSQLHPDHYWTHNDSGDTPRLFLIDRKGRTRCECQVEGAKAIDWEDMSSFTDQGTKYLVCGDIGGNAAKRKTLELYIIEEPQWSEASTGKEKAVAKVVSELTVQFADGITDFESLAFDREGSRFLLVEKGLLGGRVFSVPWKNEPGKHHVDATSIGRVAISMATSADISHDGRCLVVLSYTSVTVFERQKLIAKGATTDRVDQWEPFEETLKRPGLPFKLPPKMIQAEAVCFGHDGKTLLLTSERTPTPLSELKWAEANGNDRQR